MPGLIALVVFLMIGGLVGSLVPALPGSPLILAGALLYAVITDFDPITGLRLAILFGLAALAYALEYLSGALGAKKLGGSRWAMVGAFLGGLFGLFFGLPGLIVGPIVGAVAAELLYRRELGASLKTGVGTALGLLLGLVAKLSLAVTMVGLFAFWTIWG